MGQQTIHLFVFDTLADWEPAFAIAGLNNPAFQARPGRYRVRAVGVRREPVVSMGGVSILPDMTFDDLTPAQSAMLILPGGGGWEEGRHSQALDYAKRFLAAGVPVAAICGATAGLAGAGILDTIRHTSNALEYLQALNYQGSALYQQQPAVADGNVITAGAMAPIEFAYQIVKRLGVYSEETLEAWYGLYKTGDPSYHFRLSELAEAQTGVLAQIQSALGLCV